MNKKKTLILGLGNDILMGDRIGSQLVRDLSKTINHDNIFSEVAASGGLEILEYLMDFKKVIIIDAIRTQNGIPGDIYYLTPSDLESTKYMPSFHDINFITALKLGRTLYPDLTDDLHIIAIEILEDKEFSESLSSTLEKRYPEILAEVTSLVKEIINA